jgi:hypothetical protein
MGGTRGSGGMQRQPLALRVERGFGEDAFAAGADCAVLQSSD